ncbi:hypothetical protein DMUE_0847 [Dictyocoela muelleri]|nr:hypothetical protein DMUE_0847 [Dictyocoela muelleri]
MISKGIYKIYSTLNISKSLRELKETLKDKSKKDIHKVVIFNNKPIIAYFIDGIDFGEDSEIDIKNNIEGDLVRSFDYKILKHTPYEINYTLIDKLIAVKRGIVNK